MRARLSVRGPLINWDAPPSPTRHDQRVTSAPLASVIRAVRPKDRGAAIEVARASGLFGPEELADVEATLEGFLTGSVEGDRWLASDAAEGVVAAIAYYAPERMTDGTWNLYLLAVHPDHQGQHLGSALVRHVEQDLREIGARVLLIETSGVADFARQRAFYAGLGYAEEARIREFYGAGDDKVVYWKQL